MDLAIALWGNLSALSIESMDTGNLIIKYSSIRITIMYIIQSAFHIVIISCFSNIHLIGAIYFLTCV